MYPNTPIVSVGFFGADERVPTVFKLGRIANWLGIPYILIPPQVFPMPFPVNYSINFGEPIEFGGVGNESDEVVKTNVDTVKENISNYSTRHRKITGFHSFRMLKDAWNEGDLITP